MIIQSIFYSLLSIQLWQANSIIISFLSMNSIISLISSSYPSLFPYLHFHSYVNLFPKRKQPFYDYSFKFKLKRKNWLSKGKNRNFSGYFDYSCFCCFLWDLLQSHYVCSTNMPTTHYPCSFSLICLLLVNGHGIHQHSYWSNQ